MSDPVSLLHQVAHGARFQRTAGFGTRAGWLREIARRLEEEAPALARQMAEEMGKPVTQGLAEARKCATACRHYAEHGAGMLAPEPQGDAVVHYEPMGVVLAIMPWNFPLWQAFRFAAPALMAGNTILLKHASNVPGCARAIERIVATATGRDDLLRAIFVTPPELEPLVADPLVKALTFTGSTAAGRQVAALAGRHLKKSVLELGGSDPYLVLADADPAQAAATCAAARMINAGQSCIAGKRFLVEAPVHEAFVAHFRRELAAYRPGDPLDPATTLGPLARADLRDELHGQVRDSVRAGAVRALGGEVPDDLRPFYPATLLTGVIPGMRVFDEETFGPVAAVTRVGSADEAVHLANLSPFGLGAAVFTGDADRARSIAARLEAGTVAINGQVVSDPRHPFGGVKDSGWGRELGVHGIREFVQVKAVVGGELNIEH